MTGMPARFLLAAGLTLMAGLPALAQKAPAPGFGGLGNGSRGPINIDADKLDVFDKEKRAVFSGNVIAVQGDTTIKCTQMIVYYEGNGLPTGGAAATPAKADAKPAETKPADAKSADGKPADDSAVKRVDCKGPVTVTSKDQVATGDNAVFDRVANLVTLTGNAALSQGPNVTRGQRLVYNLNTGVANVEGGRVRAIIVPGSQDEKPGQAKPKR